MKEHHAVGVILRGQPMRRQLRKLPVDRRPKPADLDDHDSVRREPIPSLTEQPPHDVEPIAPAIMGHSRLGGEFRILRVHQP